MPWDLLATSLPQGPLRDMRIVDDADTNDFELPDSEHFIVHAATGAGAATDTLQVETAVGTTVNFTHLTAGDAVAVAGVPVGCRKTVAAGTTVDIAIGRG